MEWNPWPEIKYEPEADILRLIFGKAQLVDADEISPGVIACYAQDGELVELEVLDAHRRSKRFQAD
ncbi:MAG: DUF2283 domain-containing protein [Dehalococcoidia bacterium]